MKENRTGVSKLYCTSESPKRWFSRTGGGGPIFTMGTTIWKALEGRESRNRPILIYLLDLWQRWSTRITVSTDDRLSNKMDKETCTIREDNQVTICKIAEVH